MIFDPLTSFIIGDNENEVKMMVMRLLDLMKVNKCTTLIHQFDPWRHLRSSKASFTLRP